MFTKRYIINFVSRYLQFCLKYAEDFKNNLYFVLNWKNQSKINNIKKKFYNNCKS